MTNKADISTRQPRLGWSILALTYLSGYKSKLRPLCSPRGLKLWLIEQSLSTIGAGDTFAAGILYALYFYDSQRNTQQVLDFANELAGRKVCQEGFEGLGEGIEAWLN